jgi:hypothetical protein
MTSGVVRLKANLVDSLCDYYGEEIVGVFNDVNSENCHQVLSVANLIDAGVLVAAYLGMSGSAGDVNFYSLLRVYCLDLERREKINKIMGV